MPALSDRQEEIDDPSAALEATVDGFAEPYAAKKAPVDLERAGIPIPEGLTKSSTQPRRGRSGLDMASV